MGFQQRRSSLMLVSSATDRAAKRWRVHIGPAPKPWSVGRLQGKMVCSEARPGNLSVMAVSPTVESGLS